MAQRHPQMTAPLAGHDRDAVLSGGLGAVEALVGATEEVLGRGRVLRIGGHAAGDRLVDGAPPVEALFDSPADPVGHDVRSGPRRLGQEHRELLAAVARGGVDLTQALLDDGGGPDEDVVALDVAAGVVDLLEVVEVEHRQRELEVVPARAQHLAVQGLDEVGVVEEAGQGVGHRGALGPLVDRDLDDLGVVQLPVHVYEVIEQGHTKADVAAEGPQQTVAVGLDPPPVPVRLALGEVEMREDRQQAGVDGLARLPVALELLEQALLVRGIGLEELEQALPDVDLVCRSGRQWTFLAGYRERV